jgi:acetyl-CoA synthetase
MSLRVLELQSPLSLIVVGEAISVASTESLGMAGRLMREHNVSALLVDNGNAIVSERDMTRAIASGLTFEEEVATVATPQPIVVDANVPIVEAAALMLNEEIRHLVVRVSDDRLGIVSLRAVLAVLLQATKPDIWLEKLRLQVRLDPGEMWFPSPTGL